MLRKVLLKFKGIFYINILGLLNIFAFIGMIGCANKPNNNKNIMVDSIASIKKTNDSIANEKQRQDSLIEVRKIKDSISREDSIKNAKQLKPNYKPIKHATKYGPPPTKY